MSEDLESGAPHQEPLWLRLTHNRSFVAGLTFLFMGIWAPLIIRDVDAQRAQRELEQGRMRTELQQGLKSVRQLSRVYFARRTRAVLLRTALERGLADEVERRRVSYDEAYVDWNSSFIADRVLLRWSVVGLKGSSPGDAPWEDVLMRLVAGFALMDRELTSAYENFRRSQPVEFGEEFRSVQRRSLPCAEAFFDAMYYHVLHRTTSKWTDPSVVQQRQRLRNLAASALREQCEGF